MKFRVPIAGELNALSELCLRSKGHWGYDQAFLDNCRVELTLTQADLNNDWVGVAEDDSGIAGVAHVSFEDGDCYLEKLFVEPDRIGQGVGKQLYLWSIEAARDLGATEMIIEADPDASTFYERFDVTRDGEAPSASTAGRSLPRYIQKL